MQEIKTDVHILEKEKFFRPNENVHIQMSNEYPDYIGINHMHSYIEVVYIVSGEAIHEVNGEKQCVGRGDLFIININTPHCFYPVENSVEPFLVYDLMFTPEFFDTSLKGHKELESLNDSYMFYSLFNGDKRVTPYYRVSGSEFTLFGEIFNRIYLEHKMQETGYSEIIRAYLLELIITIFRMDSRIKKISPKQQERQIVKYITDYINNNYRTHISVSELAKEVFLHPDYLGRVFRNSTGMNISTMIQKVRIENACHLLSTTDIKISDVAHKCGFEDTKFFYKIFKKRMGILPGEYRKNTIIE